MQKIIVILSILFFLNACMPTSRSGAVYSREQARQAHQVEVGIVEAVRSVQLEGRQTPMGGVGGAVVGGIAGSSVGGGRGSAIATTLGAIAGGLLGSAIEEGATRKDALEITVRLNSGRSVAVVQEADVLFKVGERVRVLTSGTDTRVSR